MEQERGAFKVKPAVLADAVKEWLEMHGLLASQQRVPVAKDCAGILAK